MVVMMVSALTSAPESSRTCLPVAQHDDPVAVGGDLLELRGDDEKGKPVLAQALDQADDLGMGADVDAAGRLVENEEARLGGKPAREQRLLLIAAGEKADGLFRIRRADVEELDEAVGDLVLPAPREQAQPAALRLERQDDVLPHRQFRDDAFRLAILGREPEPQARGIPRRGDAHGLAVDEGLPAIGALDAEDELGRLGAAGAEKAREPHHLAGTDRQIERLQEAALAVILERDERLAGDGVALVAVQRLRREFAAEHHRHELDARQFGNRARADEAPVAQHGDPVADRIDLIEEMGDEDDADAAALEIPQDLEKRLDLVRVEARRRLVEDQHLGREIDGARDGDDLLNGDRVGAQADWRRRYRGRSLPEAPRSARRISPVRTRPKRCG